MVNRPHERAANKGDGHMAWTTAPSLTGPWPIVALSSLRPLKAWLRSATLSACQSMPLLRRHCSRITEIHLLPCDLSLVLFGLGLTEQARSDIMYVQSWTGGLAARGNGAEELSRLADGGTLEYHGVPCTVRMGENDPGDGSKNTAPAWD